MDPDTIARALAALDLRLAEGTRAVETELLMRRLFHSYAGLAEAPPPVPDGLIEGLGGIGRDAAAGMQSGLERRLDAMEAALGGIATALKAIGEAASRPATPAGDAASGPGQNPPPAAGPVPVSPPGGQAPRRRGPGRFNRKGRIAATAPTLPLEVPAEAGTAPVPVKVAAPEPAPPATTPAEPRPASVSDEGPAAPAAPASGKAGDGRADPSAPGPDPAPRRETNRPARGPKAPDVAADDIPPQERRVINLILSVLRKARKELMLEDFAQDREIERAMHAMRNALGGSFKERLDLLLRNMTDQGWARGQNGGYVLEGTN